MGTASAGAHRQGSWNTERANSTCTARLCRESPCPQGPRCKHHCCPFAMDHTNASGATGTHEGSAMDPAQRTWSLRGEKAPQLYRRRERCSQCHKDPVLRAHTTVPVMGPTRCRRIAEASAQGHHHGFRLGLAHRPAGAFASGPPRVGGWRRTTAVLPRAASLVLSCRNKKGLRGPL